MAENIILDFDLLLKVDFNDKERAKKLGVKPFVTDGVFKCWYAPKGKDVSVFKEWWPDEFRKSRGEQSDVLPKNTETGISLKELMGQIKGTIEKNHSSAIWIRAEVVNLSGFKPHVYMELTDYDVNGSEQAKARGMIWGSQVNILNKFESETGMPLKSGVKILFKAYVDFSEKFGFGLRIVEIDSNFTLGDMEAKLISIRKKLKDDGVYDLNKKLTQPRDFMNIAVIAPEEAAGLGDFMSKADKLSEFGLCKFENFSAKFQGQYTKESISKTLDNISMLLNMGRSFDAIVFIRGGGDKAGLYSLNEYDIAKRICEMPIPVIVGIGHERDNTILDEVACIRCATPSLVVSLINDTIISNAKQAREDFIRIKKMASDAIHRAKLSCEKIDAQIKSAASNQLHQSRLRVEKQFNLINENAKFSLSVARNKIKQLMTEALYADPIKIINKGYALIRNENGKVEGNSLSIDTGETITVQMRDGCFFAKKQIGGNNGNN